MATAETAPRRLERLRCLIVDDDPWIGSLLVESISRLGGHATIAHSYDSAIDLINQDDAVDVGIIDVNLNGEAVGLTLARELLLRKPAANVLMISGLTQRPISDFDPELEARVSFLSKPFGLAELAAVLNDISTQAQ